MQNCFDETTYEGRFKKFLELTNVRHLFHSKQKIKSCQEHISSGKYPSYDAYTTVAACIHPATNKIIPAYGRMAFFVPANIPICSGMLLTRPTLLNVIGWQWINQTYNAIFNYSNSAEPVSLEKLNLDHPLVKGYIGSVTLSVGLAVGLTQWVKRGRLPLSLKNVMQKFVPYVATASAGMTNVVLMRKQELTTGISIKSSEGTYIGRSKKAAKKALLETAMSRAVLPIPMLLLPPPFIAIASKLNFFTSSYLRKKSMELSLLVASIVVGLPTALALYPQESHVKLSELEPELQQDKHLSKDQIVTYNKGV